MTHAELHQELSELLYIEDQGMVDIIMASIVANSMKIGDPVWLTLIGPSSGGKSQIIRPFGQGNHALIHRIDDMTANSLLSGQGGLDNSFLGRVGPHGILSMDDLTVLFSKNVDARGEILGQFRMLYDGRFAKITGSRNDEMVWEGYLGMISASTPMIYRFFGEVADMGERFVNYRMKPFDKDKLLAFISDHQMSSRELDDRLADVFARFVHAVVPRATEDLLELDKHVENQINGAASHFTLLRTPVHLHPRYDLVDDFPEAEMPSRVQKQLLVLAKALQVVRGRKLTDEDLDDVLWVGYSLSNDKRRAYMKVMMALDLVGKQITAREIAAATGFDEIIVKHGLSSLRALKIIEYSDSGVEEYKIKNPELVRFISKLDTPYENH